jgi:two-component system sensor histidine kinase AgrC
MKKQVQIRKATVYAVVINGLQILLVLGIALYTLFGDVQFLHLASIRIVVAGAALLACWGSIVDIREALNTARSLSQMAAMERSFLNMESLYNTLRAQRHDFLNHLQVVYSLMEMEEYKDAREYIERVYGDITAVNRTLRTASPAINALLTVKLAAGEKQGVRTEVHISSLWENLPIPAWEMCRVLANLIDNALEALKHTKSPRLTLSLTEDLKALRFAVSNNGPDIPPQEQGRIFLPGITTRAGSHGMGLYIVRRILQERGGDIALATGTGETTFSGWLPKEPAAPHSEQNATKK